MFSVANQLRQCFSIAVKLWERTVVAQTNHPATHHICRRRPPPHRLRRRLYRSGCLIPFAAIELSTSCVASDTGATLAPAATMDMLSRLQGTKRCRLMISRVCSFEQSSSSSISSGTCSSSRETSNTDLSSGDDTGAVSPDGEANEGDADRQSDNSGDPELTKMTTHYLLQLVPCQLLVGPQSLKSTHRKQRREGGHRGSSTKDETMFVIG